MSGVPISEICNNSSGKASKSANSSYRTQSFVDQRQIEVFVRGNKLLRIIEEVTDQFIKSYNQSKCPEDALEAIVVHLTVSYTELLQRPLELLHLAIEEPLQFENSIKYCVFGIVRNIIKERGNSDFPLKVIDIEQVHILLRFLDLPLQQDLCFKPHLNKYPTGLALVVGVLSAHTEAEKEVLQSVWFCAFGCSRNKLKSLQVDVPLCSYCLRPMSEYSKLRYNHEYHLLRLLPVAAVETPRQLNKIFRSITVRLRKHVFDCSLILGRRYLVTGYYSYNQAAQEFQAWNLTPI